MTIWTCTRNPLHGQFLADDCSRVRQQHQQVEQDKKPPHYIERLACPKCGDFVKPVGGEDSPTIHRHGGGGE
jgi:hypothetical protein